MWHPYQKMLKKTVTVFQYSAAPLARVARSKKIKKAKFGHKQFQKRPNPEK